MLYNHWPAILSKLTINSQKFIEIRKNLEKIKKGWWKKAEWPDFNTVYCYYRRKGAKQPEFNTIYCYYKYYTTLPQNVDEREQSDLTSTLYTATTNTWWKEAKQPDFNTIYYYHRRKRAKRPNFNTIYCYYKHYAIVMNRPSRHLTSHNG